MSTHKKMERQSFIHTSLLSRFSLLLILPNALVTPISHLRHWNPSIVQCHLHLYSYSAKVHVINTVALKMLGNVSNFALSVLIFRITRLWLVISTHKPIKLWVSQVGLGGFHGKFMRIWSYEDGISTYNLVAIIEVPLVCTNVSYKIILYSKSILYLYTVTHRWQKVICMSSTSPFIGCPSQLTSTPK